MKTQNFGQLRLWGVVCACLSILAARGQVNLTIGTMQPGQEVLITYEVTLNASLLPAVTQISSQGTVAGTGFTSPKSTDDPETTTANDATVITLQNDAPVVTAGNTVSYTENDPPVIISSGLTVTDTDSASLSGATVSITGGNFSSGDTLGFTDQNGISGSYSSGAGILTLSGSASVANYQTALRSVTFSSTTDDPGSSRTISFVASDGITDSSAATSTINVSAVNDAPVVTAGNTIDYSENAAPTAISTGLTVTDPDNSDLSGASVSITSGFLAGDTLGFASQNGITGSYDSGTGVLTLSGTATVANYQTALRSVTFSSSSDNPTANGANPGRTISFIADDGIATSTPVTSTINVTAVNDNPVAGTDSIERAPNDDVKIEVATLLANDTDPENDTLTITAVTSPTPGGATVKMSNGWIYYSHVGTTTDSFTYTLNDGKGGVSLGTVNVTIQGQDTQAGPALTPTVDGTGAHVTFDGIPGRAYTMQSAPAPSGPWSDVGPATEDGTGHFKFDDGAALPANFYRAVYRP